MPNRFLKESITTSENIDSLTADAERFFYRLTVVCDDFGRMDARPSVLRARCFPLKLDRITDGDVAVWMDELTEADLVRVYEADGRPYLQVTTWTKHQTVRAKASKFPDPPAPAIKRKHVKASASRCEQPKANAPVFDIRVSSNEVRGTGTEMAPPAPNPSPPERESPLPTDAQQLVNHVIQHGLRGVKLGKKAYGKQAAHAKTLLEDHPLEWWKTAATGMDSLWKFRNGDTWDVFDLGREGPKAYAEASAPRKPPRASPPRGGPDRGMSARDIWNMADEVADDTGTSDETGSTAEGPLSGGDDASGDRGSLHPALRPAPLRGGQGGH